MSLYRNILKQALMLSWQNKHLWFFGLFAALFIDNSGFEFFLQMSGGNGLGESVNKFTQTGILSFQGISNAASLLTKEPLAVIASLLILLVFLALFLFLIWLTIVSQVAIVNNSASIFSNKKVKLQDGVMAGIRKFWPALLLNFIAFLVMLIPLFLGNFNPSQLILKILYIILFLLIAVLVIAFSFVLKFAIASLVIKDNNFSESLKKGWELFAKNWVISIEMALLLFAIGLFGYISIRFLLLPLLAMSVLFIGLILYSLLSFSNMVAFVVFMVFYILGYIASFIIIVLFGAYLAVFQITAWTKLYIELSGKGAQSKISRIVESFRNK